MKYKFLFVACCLMCGNAKTQEKMETDRPSETETPAIVLQGWFQAELGLLKQNHKKDYALAYPTALLKYGVSKMLELRVEGNWIAEHHEWLQEEQTITGLKPLEVGAKVGLTEEQGWRPQTSLIAHFGLPFLGYKGFRTAHLIPSFRLAMQNHLAQKVELGYNFGAEWDGQSTIPEWIYTLAPGFEIGKRWYVFIEFYGSIKQGETPENNLDGGIAFNLSENMRADLSGGVSLSQQAFDNFVALGFSFRVPVLKRHAAAAH